MKRILPWLLAITIILAWTAIPDGVQATEPTSPPQSESAHVEIPPCQEDDPCWDCETMGNRICGPSRAPVPTLLPDTALPSS